MGFTDGQEEAAVEKSGKANGNGANVGFEAKPVAGRRQDA